MDARFEIHRQDDGYGLKIRGADGDLIALNGYGDSVGAAEGVNEVFAAVTSMVSEGGSPLNTVVVAPEGEQPVELGEQASGPVAGGAGIVNEPPTGEGEPQQPSDPEDPPPAEAPQDAEPEQPETVTSQISEKPLYLVDAEEAPEGFIASGLETPDGKALYQYEADTPGQSATGNVDAVSVYADAEDNEQPVCYVAPEGSGDAVTDAQQGAATPPEGGAA